MNYSVADDARPQLKLLIISILISIGFYMVSWFFPLTSYLFYPLQLFATFVHEGSHVLAALITGSQVQSLTVSPDTSGVVWSAANGWLAQLLISSAGYLGTTAFGTLLLVWMRYGFSSRIALYFASGFVGLMTIVFGLIFPIMNIFSAKVSFGSVAFTVFSGAILASGLFAISRFAQLKWANFALAFLSVQCLLNAFFSLKDLFLISTMTDAQSDALNMANATGLPSVLWVFIWIGISMVMISIGLRIYVATQKSSGTTSL